MFTLLVRAVLFGLVILATMFMMESYSGRYVDIYDYYKLTYDELFRPMVNADIVILGASHGTHGINPKAFESYNHNVFNFCLNGANPIFTDKWYELFIRYYNRPSVIIYEVNWFMFDSAWMNRKFEQDSKYFPVDEFIQQLVDRTNDVNQLVRNRYKILKLGNKYQLFVKGDIKVQYDKFYNGYVPQIDVKGPVIVKIAKNNEDQISKFIELVDKIKSTGIKFVFVQAPEYIPGRQSPLIESNNRLLREIASKRGILFLNYNDENKSYINYSEEMFYDWGHLNERGSNIFSDKLSKDLNKYISH